MYVFIHNKLESNRMVSRLNSFALMGVDAFVVAVEATLTRGIPSFDIVGLPDTAVKESRNRVRSAVTNCGYKFPMGVITLNLAPADIRKEGSVYDLPVFISMLNISGEFDFDVSDMAFIGELSLSGEVRPVKGVLPMCIAAKRNNIKNIFVPYDNAYEASVIDGINVYPVLHVNELVDHLTGNKLIKKVDFAPPKVESSVDDLDFSQVKGQESTRRAVEVAVAGGHNILMVGSPGSGKSMIAKRIPSILPDMSFDEMIETTKIYSISGKLDKGKALITHRPFRSPHHTVSSFGLTGGGAIPTPGEISLAHNGVLFLDELPEFGRSTMEVLRQPIEDGKITISRVNSTLTYPCSLMLVAAMNPCPCGYYGHPTRRCTCSSNAVSNYLSKISGPMLDRFDLHVEVPPVDFVKLDSNLKSETSAEIRKRVTKAREIQKERFRDTKIVSNARINSAIIKDVCVMSEAARNILKEAFERLSMSARTYDRLLKVSRTIADLDSSEIIDVPHILEALQYRALDNKYWVR